MVASARKLADTLKEKAAKLGFDVCRITPANLQSIHSDHLEQFVHEGNHASMQWMADTLERRKSPVAMWHDARTAILLGMNYGPDTNPMGTLSMREKATISVYARNRDYHQVIKGKLKELAGWLASASTQNVKVFVDTAPLMEKPLAQNSGLGWQGKHTNLVSRVYGSWLFLGTILTCANLPEDPPESDHCGSCRACLDICPTNAFPKPYRLDARKCISYLTIEHHGPIPLEYRQAMGNRIYGCDDCLAVCPWNKYAQATREAKLTARDDLRKPALASLLELDDKAFRDFFSGSAIKRIGRNRFIRNVLIAAGNSKSHTLKKAVTRHLSDPDPIVRGAAVWAYSCLEKANVFDKMKIRTVPHETDKNVIREWERNG